MPADLENFAVATGLFSSGQFSFQSQRGNAKECSNYCTIALISHANKIILKARLQQYVNHELPDVLNLAKLEQPEIK